MAPREEIITAADMDARLAALDGWHGTTAGISKVYAIGYEAAIQAVAEIGVPRSSWSTGRTLTSGGTG